MVYIYQRIAAPGSRRDRLRIRTDAMVSIIPWSNS